MTNQDLYNERVQLIQDSIALKPTKRMVNAVRVNYWPYLEYGMTLADACGTTTGATSAFTATTGNLTRTWPACARPTSPARCMKSRD